MAERQKSSRQTPTPTTRTTRRRRRRSSTTNTLSRGLGGCSFDGIVGVAETRKEIANALQLHRSSSNNTSVAATKNEFAGTTSNTTSSVISNIFTCCGSCRGIADCTCSTLLHHPPYCSFSAAASMNKLPGFSYLFQPNYLVSQPIWSTTSPAIFPTPSFTAASNSTGDVVYNICDEQQEDQLIDWGDHLADSSYTWWLGFLKSLDGSGGINDVDQICKQPQEVQRQELHKEDQNLSCLEHHEWLIEPETATN